MKKWLMLWLGTAGTLIVIFGTIYVAVQQAQRMDANNPQIQIAEDTAAALNQGATPRSIATGNVDMRTSLEPFVIIYDQSGNSIAGNGTLSGKSPAIPYGVLSAAKGNDYHAVTWQPDTGVRIAAVAVAANPYYVVSGRSLKEVEKNEDRTLRLCVLGGFLATIAISGAYYMVYRSNYRK